MAIDFAERPHPAANRLLLEDKAAGWSALVREDGCVDLRRWFNGDGGEADEIHLCSLDETIARLGAIKAAAAARFGAGWG